MDTVTHIMDTATHIMGTDTLDLAVDIIRHIAVHIHLFITQLAPTAIMGHGQMVGLVLLKRIVAPYKMARSNLVHLEVVPQ